MCEITEKWKCSEDEERGWGRGGGGLKVCSMHFSLASEMTYSTTHVYALVCSCSSVCKDDSLSRQRAGKNKQVCL